jgi:hypothetical protein
MNHCIAPLQQSIDEREILQQAGFDADAGGSQLLQPLALYMQLGAASGQDIDAELMGA